MEPCLFRHGKDPGNPGRGHGPHASMEPCLFRHGKWSTTARASMSACRLQWSHVFSDMVSLEPVLRGQVLPLASMEPCLFRHGKGVVEAEEVDPVLPASMEPCLFRHGKRALGY